MILKDYIKKKDYDYINVRIIKPWVDYKKIDNLFDNSFFVECCSSEEGDLISTKVKDYITVLYAEEWKDESKGINNGIDVICR